MTAKPSTSASPTDFLRDLATALRASAPGSIERRKLETALAEGLLPPVLRYLRLQFPFGRVAVLPYDLAAYGDFWMDGANWGIAQALRRTCLPLAAPLQHPLGFACKVGRRRMLDVVRELRVRERINSRPGHDDPEDSRREAQARRMIDPLDVESFAWHVTELLDMSERSDAGLWLTFFAFLVLDGPTDFVRANLAQIQRALVTAVSATPKRDRAAAAETCVIVLRLLELSDPEIGVLLGLAASSVAKYFERGKHRLSRILRYDLGLYERKRSCQPAAASRRRRVAAREPRTTAA